MTEPIPGFDQLPEDVRKILPLVDASNDTVQLAIFLPTLEEAVLVTVPISAIATSVVPSAQVPQSGVLYLGPDNVRLVGGPGDFNLFVKLGLRAAQRD